MKFLFAAMVPMAFLACNDRMKYTEEQVAEKFTDWYIPASHAGEMARNYSTCTFSDRRQCEIRDHSKYEVVDRQVKEFFKGPEWVFTWICGRYDATDVNRYHKTRPRTDPEAEKIAGFATFTLEVSNLKTAEIYYFDYAIICPPPNGTCDLAPPVSAEN